MLTSIILHVLGTGWSATSFFPYTLLGRKGDLDRPDAMMWGLNVVSIPPHEQCLVEVRPQSVMWWREVWFDRGVIRRLVAGMPTVDV